MSLYIKGLNNINIKQKRRKRKKHWNKIPINAITQNDYKKLDEVTFFLKKFICLSHICMGVYDRYPS
ncbi:MAG TPA: hypothetical protein PJ990_08755, partial [Saprospiraceae bacterium]|nr:hypothetical protein [Saprospiraceae bacterium]